MFHARKPKYFELFLLSVLYISVFIAPYLGSGLSWTLREPLFILFCSVFFLRRGLFRLPLISLEFGFFFLYSFIISWIQ